MVGLHRIGLIGAALAVAVVGHAASAQSVADFYRGKTFNLYSGTGENSSGSVVQYARTKIGRAHV